MNIRNFSFIFYQLTRPFSYLRIKHDDKWIYDWLAPIILSIATMLVMFFFIPIGKIIGESGLIAKLCDFVANLPGFFIAALAAVATFNKDDIDEVMSNPPKIEIMYGGGISIVDMTRRRFLCVLFSYLTAISIFIVIFSRIGLSIQLPARYPIEVSWIGISLFSLALWQMIVAAVLGLYYLGERLHAPQ